MKMAKIVVEKGWDTYIKYISSTHAYMYTDSLKMKYIYKLLYFQAHIIGDSSWLVIPY